MPGQHPVSDQDAGRGRLAPLAVHPHPHPCRSMASGVIAFPFELAIYTVFSPGPLLVMETCPHIYLCGSHFCVASLAMLNWFIIFQRRILTFPVANMRPVCFTILHFQPPWLHSPCSNRSSAYQINFSMPWLDTSGHKYGVSYSRLLWLPALLSQIANWAQLQDECNFWFSVIFF